MKEHIQYMRAALEEAKKALPCGDVPIGAVIVKEGRIIAAGYNMREQKQCAVAHAEIVAIQNACEKLGNWQLPGCSMYVTVEPCPMCAGALLNARIKQVFFGAYQENTGAVGSKFNLFYDFVWDNPVAFRGGILEAECALLVRTFFEDLRSASERK